MSQVLARVAFALSLVLGSGCATTLSSRPVASSGGLDGVEYALPLPLIEVIPQPNGTLAVSVKYIPDPNNRYVLASSSFLSTHTLSVETENGGLLKKVVLDAVSSDVAAAAIGAAGELRKAQLTGKATDEKEADAALETASRALADAEVKLNQAKAKLDKLEELQKDPNYTVDPKDLLAAQLAIVEAQIARDAAAAGVAKLGASKDQNAALDAGVGPESAKFPKAWGPVYYRVVQGIEQERRPTLKLIPVTFPVSDPTRGIPQVRFDTTEIAKPEAPAVPEAKFGFKGSGVLTSKTTGRYEFTVEISGVTVVKVMSCEITNITSGQTESDDEDLVPALQLDGKSIVVTFSKPRVVGTYSLKIGYTDNKGKQRSAAVPFRIVPAG